MKIVNTNFQDGAYEGLIVKAWRLESRKGEYSCIVHKCTDNFFEFANLYIHKANRKEDLEKDNVGFSLQSRHLEPYVERKLKFKDILKKEEV